MDVSHLADARVFCLKHDFPDVAAFSTNNLLCRNTTMCFFNIFSKRTLSGNCLFYEVMPLKRGHAISKTPPRTFQKEARNLVRANQVSDLFLKSDKNTHRGVSAEQIVGRKCSEVRKIIFFKKTCASAKCEASKGPPKGYPRDKSHWLRTKHFKTPLASLERPLCTPLVSLWCPLCVYFCFTLKTFESVLCRVLFILMFFVLRVPDHVAFAISGLLKERCANVFLTCFCTLPKAPEGTQTPHLVRKSTDAPYTWKKTSF